MVCVRVKVWLRRPLSERSEDQTLKVSGRKLCLINRVRDRGGFEMLRFGINRVKLRLRLGLNGRRFDRPTLFARFLDGQRAS